MHRKAALKTLIQFLIGLMAVIVIVIVNIYHPLFSVATGLVGLVIFTIKSLYELNKYVIEASLRNRK